MNGVKAVAALNGVLGWVTLALSCLAVVVILTQFERMFGPRADLTAAASLLVILSLGAIGPFSIWAGLTALCKLHEQEERVLTAVQALERTINKLAMSGAGLDADIAAGSQAVRVDRKDAGTVQSTDPFEKGRQEAANKTPLWARMLESLGNKYQT